MIGRFQTAAYRTEKELRSFNENFSPNEQTKIGSDPLKNYDFIT